MKLTEFAPRWCSENYRAPFNGQDTEIGPTAMLGYPARHGMGLSFLCPVHRDHRLAVMFMNPVDGLPAGFAARHRWQRTGETFENLTLGPSIDASGNLHGDAVQTPCWHGFITNGEIR